MSVKHPFIRCMDVIHLLFLEKLVGFQIIKLVIPEAKFRGLLSVLTLSCYVLSICHVLFIEGLHFLSPYVLSDDSHAIHSYHSHEDSHDHIGLNMIDTTDDNQTDKHNSTPNPDAEKKYQIDSNEAMLIDSNEVIVKSNLDLIYSCNSRPLDICTPPPQV
jgi:hypothetical protein